MRSAIAEPSAGSIPADAESEERALELRSISTIVDEHLHFVWRVLRRLGLSPPDADDAAQHVFLVAAEKLRSIAPKAERAFLYSTAVRVAANSRRSLERRREVPDLALEFEPHPAAGPERRLELSQATELLDELLARLPPEQARALVLVELEQMTVSDLAEFEEVPLGTAASRLRLARRAFRQLLEQVEDRNPLGGREP